MFKRTLFTHEHELFRDTVRKFIEREIAPYHAQWEHDGIVPRDLWIKAGEAGMLCCTVPEEYGGLGLDYLFDVVVFEEMARSGFTGPGFLIHCDLVSTYVKSFGTEEQKKQWLPKMVSGEAIGSLGMTEPHAGSDLSADAMLGEEGQGFKLMMTKLAQERLAQAIRSATVTETLIEMTVDYTANRKAFGTTIGAFQNTQFKLAELHTESVIGRIFTDHCIAKFMNGELDEVDAAMAKMWLSNLHCKTADECLQLFGGWGYMWEYPISRAFADCRIVKIAGGSIEVMKLIIGRSLFGRVSGQERVKAIDSGAEQKRLAS